MRPVTRIASVPRAHLAMHKMVVNQVMLTMGLEQTQMMATVFDGISRHTSKGLWFRRYAQTKGFQAAVQALDSGLPIPDWQEATDRVAQLRGQAPSFAG